MSLIVKLANQGTKIKIIVPFNAAAEISFVLAEEQSVQIVIYTINGRHIATLANDKYQAGYHTVVWNGQDLHGHSAPSGVYLYHIQAGTFAATKKMSLIR
jgi:flagellar hook assembly protein FlgD